MIPTGLQAAALFEQALSVEQNNFFFPIYQILVEKVINPYVSELSARHCLSDLLIMFVMSRRKGIETNEERAKANVAAFEQNLDAYDRILSKQKYLAGDVSR